MFSTADTIVAIATPSGRGALGVVRLSGPDAPRIADALLRRTSPLQPRLATFARLSAGTVRDQVVATLFPRPASYTGEDVVEISTHGSRVVLEAVVRAALDAGARLAAPGEFTLRAFLNERMDLPQAEAVADLIDAVTPLQARAAFDQLNGTLTGAIGEIEAELFDLIARLEASVDFPDEGYHFVEPGAVSDAIESVVRRIDRLLASGDRGRLIREGAQIVIAGRPNAGKSSLFNALVGAHRAIVTDIAGTTRDLLTETVDLGGLRTTLIDSAGLTESADVIEQEGVRRAGAAIAASDLVLLVCDSSAPWNHAGVPPEAVAVKTVIVASKSDLPSKWERADAVRVSATTGEGLETLIARIHAALGGPALAEPLHVTNVRHIDLLTKTKAALRAAADAVTASGGALSEEFVLADLQGARRFLEEVTGRRGSDEILIHVFERFCVGK